MVDLPRYLIINELAIQMTPDVNKMMFEKQGTRKHVSKTLTFRVL